MTSGHTHAVLSVVLPRALLPVTAHPQLPAVARHTEARSVHEGHRVVAGMSAHSRCRALGFQHVSLLWLCFMGSSAAFAWWQSPGPGSQQCSGTGHPKRHSADMPPPQEAVTGFPMAMIPGSVPHHVLSLSAAVCARMGERSGHDRIAVVLDLAGWCHASALPEGACGLVGGQP